MQIRCKCGITHYLDDDSRESYVCGCGTELKGIFSDEPIRLLEDALEKIRVGFLAQFSSEDLLKEVLRRIEE